MIEFDNYLTKVYTQADAVAQRISTRLSMYQDNIPYFPMGMLRSLFTYEDPAANIDVALMGIGVPYTVDITGERVIVANIEFDVRKEIESMTGGV